MDFTPIFTIQTIAAIIGGLVGGVSAVINRTDYTLKLKLVLVCGSVILSAGVCDILKVRIGLESFWLTLCLGYLVGIPAGNIVEAIKSASPNFGKRLVKAAEDRIIEKARGISENREDQPNE